MVSSSGAEPWPPGPVTSSPNHNITKNNRLKKKIFMFHNVNNKFLKDFFYLIIFNFCFPVGLDKFCDFEVKNCYRLHFLAQSESVLDLKVRS